MKRKAERGERKRTTKKNGMNNGTRRSRSQESRKKDRQTGRQADRQTDREKRERKRGCGTEHCCVLTSKKDSSTGSAAWKSLEGKNGGGPGAGSLGGRECISTTTNNKIYTHIYIYIYILENKYKNIYI